MSSHIRDQLYQHIPIRIDQKLLNDINRVVLQFEIRDEHPLTINSQMFGVYKFSFTKRDFQLFFELVGHSEESVAAVIKKIPSINNDFKVVSDPFNILCVYVAHLIMVSNLQIVHKKECCKNLLNFMQYRFMGSAINHYFPHGANHDIMQSVVESLSMKFSIRQLESWRAVVTERSLSMTYDTKAHNDTLLKFDTDKNILYLITDTSTRIRSQLKIITGEYYAVRETNNFILSHSSTASLDGEKVLREKNSSFESVSHIVYNKILIKSSFIDERYVKMVQSTVSRLNVSIIRRMLSAIADEARYQVGSGESMRIIPQKNGSEIYVGIQSLIDHIIHVIYASAIMSEKVNINSKIAIYTHTKNIVTAARSSNQELINVKASLEYFFKKHHISTRESTISGLTIVFVLYIALISFNSI